jgi:phage terminase large subunit-like protein
MDITKKINQEAYDTFNADPVAFVRAFDREPWPFQADILRQVLERDDQGKFTNSMAVVSMPRQNGKSTLSAWIALWRLYIDPDPQEIISVALDRAGAGIILNTARRIIRRSNVLYSCLDRHGLARNEIRLKDGRKWIIRPSDAAYSRGYSPSTICYDELGWATDRELFDVLASGQAARHNPLMVATSTVGPVQAGVLWDLFESHRIGDDDVRLIYNTENLSPLVTPEYLEKQRRLQPAHVYAREHENRWGEGTDAFCVEADWRRATADGDPRRRTDPGPTFAFLDLGWVHDESVLAVGKEEEGKVAIIALEIWRGTQRDPVNFAAIQAKIEELTERLNIAALEIESPQGVAMSQDLNLRGVNTTIEHPTAKGQSERWGALYTSLKNGSVMLPNDAMLRRQLLTLTIKSGTTGWRVIDQPSIHQDRAMACAGAVHLVQTGQPKRVIW